MRTRVHDVYKRNIFFYKGALSWNKMPVVERHIENDFTFFFFNSFYLLLELIEMVYCYLPIF